MIGGIVNIDFVSPASTKPFFNITCIVMVCASSSIVTPHHLVKPVCTVFDCTLYVSLSVLCSVDCTLLNAVCPQNCLSVLIIRFPILSSTSGPDFFVLPKPFTLLCQLFPYSKLAALSCGGKKSSSTLPSVLQHHFMFLDPTQSDPPDLVEAISTFHTRSCTSPQL